MLYTSPSIQVPHIQQVVISKPVEAPKPQPVLYTIKEGDNLTTIAEAQTTTVARLWAKNTALTDPNHIEPGKPLEIPQNDETLPPREFPVVQPTIPVTPVSNTPHYASTGINMYTPGQCTSYAWSRRPDLPGNLGNADTWGTMAAVQGFTVNANPSVGSIGVARGYMHVVYVEAVYGNGTVLVSEQNYQGPFIVSSRVAPTSEFVYIH